MITRITPLRAHADERVTDALVEIAFPHVAALADQAACTGDRRRASFHNAASESWDLDAGFDGAVAMATMGWPEGTDRVREAMRHMLEADVRADRVPTRARAMHAGGGRVHVPTFLSGNPRCYARPADDVVHDVTRILVSSTFHAGYDATLACNRGAAIAVHVDDLERRGHRVELSIGMRTGHHLATFACTCVVKRAEDPLDLDALAFAVAHAAVLRRLGFAIMEQYAGYAWDRMITTGYGRPADSTSDEHRCVPMAQTAGDWRTPESSARSVARILPTLDAADAA